MMSNLIHCTYQRDREENYLKDYQSESDMPDPDELYTKLVASKLAKEFDPKVTEDQYEEKLLEYIDQLRSGKKTRKINIVRPKQVGGMMDMIMGMK